MQKEVKLLDNLLFQNAFLAMYEREGYIFLHEVRTNGLNVALLPFRIGQSGYQYLARVEICPAHSMTPAKYSITGGSKHGESMRECAQRELLEEAGYVANQDELIDLGVVRPSKREDTITHIFGVDVSNKPQKTPTGDGSRWEEDSSVEWVNFEEGLSIQDPLFVTALSRLERMLK